MITVRCNIRQMRSLFPFASANALDGRSTWRITDVVSTRTTIGGCASGSSLLVLRYPPLHHISGLEQKIFSRILHPLRLEEADLFQIFRAFGLET